MINVLSSVGCASKSWGADWRFETALINSRNRSAEATFVSSLPQIRFVQKRDALSIPMIARD
jgi:hypothetical protein